MTEERSPWSRPDTETVVGPVPGASPSEACGEEPAPVVAPVTRPEPISAATEHRSGAVTRLGAASAGLPGAVTRLGAVLAAPPAAVTADESLLRERRLRRWLLAAAAAVMALGLVAVLGLAVTGQFGGGGLLSHPLAGPGDTRPELAKRCPPPSDAPSRPKDVPPAPPGPRTVDNAAGISYAAYGAPWEPWDQVWSGGTLKVTYRVGQHFITEPGPDQRGYHASILSGSVPATVNDAMVIDLECTGRQVAADVRSEYYLQPNMLEPIRDERATIGGLSAWVTKFRLRFDRAGLKAKDELVAVVLVDVGRPEVAILYVSIPGTHREWDRIVNDVIDSVRPT